MDKEKSSVDFLDETDIRILRVLQEDSSLTTKEIAEQVNLSTTPVFERIRRLKNEGYIKKYIAVLDGDKLGLRFTVFCLVKMVHVNADIMKSFYEYVMKMEEVSECYNISGEFDFLLKVNAPDMKTYRMFVLEKLGQIKEMGAIQSIFVMDEIKHTYGYNI